MRLYTRAGIGFTWQRLRVGERFRIYASPHNPGALELTQELSCLLQHLDIELEVTTSVADLTACSHMLLYLDKRTWTETENDQRIAALSSDVKAALAKRVHLLPVHESEPFEYMAGSHAGVKFDDLLDCVDGATPIELLQRQVSPRALAASSARSIVPSTRLHLCLSGLRGGCGAAQRRHLSARKPAAARTRCRRPDADFGAATAHFFLQRAAPALYDFGGGHPDEQT